MEFERTKIGISLHPLGNTAPLFPVDVFVDIALTSFPALKECKETTISIPPKARETCLLSPPQKDGKGK